MTDMDNNQEQQSFTDSPSAENTQQQQPIHQSGQKAPSTTTITLKWWHLLVAVIAVAALSVACTLLAVNLTKPAVEASPEPEKQQSVEPKEPEGEPETIEAETSERGYLIKRIGDEAAILKTDRKTELATWALTGIDVDAPCTADYSEPSENGHFVTLSFDVETNKDLIEVRGYSFMLGAVGQWRYYLADGTLWNGDPTYGNARSCLARTEQLPDTIGASAKASGKIAFDLPTTDGVLVFSEDGGASGWEYPLKEHPTA